MSEVAKGRSAAARRRWRWVRRGLLLLAVLVVVIIVIVQIILWTPLPRHIVIPIIERQLGLRVEADSLSAGWFGTTVLRDVKIGLPLSEQDLLTAPTLRVSHNWLVGLLISGNFRLDEIDVSHPTANIRQYSSGRWNVQEAGELIARAVSHPGATASRTPPILPEIHIDHGIVNVRDNHGRSTQLEPLSVSAMRTSSIVYRYDVQIGERVALAGNVVPGGLWLHELTLKFNDIDAWMRPLANQWPNGVRGEFHWRGQIDAQTRALRGRLDIAALEAADLSITGALRSEIAAQGVDLRPAGLIVRTSQPAAPEIHVVDGTVHIGGGEVRASALQLAGAGGEAALSGTWNQLDGSADINLQWRDLSIFDAATYSGSASATLRTPWPGGPRIDARIDTTGALRNGDRWDARARVIGTGPDFVDIDWLASVEQLTVKTDRRTTTLNDLRAHVQTRPHTLILTDLEFGRRAEPYRARSIRLLIARMVAVAARWRGIASEDAQRKPALRHFPLGPRALYVPAEHLLARRRPGVLHLRHVPDRPTQAAAIERLADAIGKTRAGAGGKAPARPAAR